MKIYTKTGDAGTTSLRGGERVEKFDLRVEAYGTVDELAANIAMFRDMLVARGGFEEPVSDLAEILSDLMGIAALMSVGRSEEHKLPDWAGSRIEWLEGRIDETSALLEPVKKFTLPGGDTLVSMAHICRTVCRRAERRAAEAAFLHGASNGALVYLNRLSDYLYVAGRRIVSELNIKESLWELHI